uniref:HIG1 domain-containing protein n=1 Tax=Piliocolobus tephrosceles TaxID=591936 RepID=A0A8C9HD53_9PRIM
MANPSTVTPGTPFEPSQSAVIEGFSHCSNPESFKEKFLCKTCKNPTVPIGCLGKAVTLTDDLSCFHQGHSQCSQLTTRTCITTQGFTVTAILLGQTASTMESRLLAHCLALKA